MTNIVSLRRQGAASCDPAIPGLIDLFATRRRGQHDAFWLKENAELLQILAALGLEADLEPLRHRAKGLMQEVRFFPQYYRMYLSLALDLRDLGLTEAPVAELADFVVTQDLPSIELSDTHRGEAELLLRRAGLDRHDAGLEARLARFGANAAAFCLPNRRAAYDLTHIVFHAADYGRRTIARDPARRLSLMHVGLVAWLEGNLDLLAEVALALHLSGEEVPALWSQAVVRAADQVDFVAGARGISLDDDYHQYLVLNWARGVLGQSAFPHSVPAQARVIRQPRAAVSALHELSLVLLDMGEARHPDWSRMRWRIWAKLSEPARQCLEQVEGMAEFEGFFAGFSRAGRIGGALK
ncbi:DUF6902 family protein [Pseudotabrizicola algicola]|uniref:Uncharacterized protein n=1 Tax=Pseudotabrizicola algicola TaxID=2709381 RepID=A0A6B3RII7_9RHOB|nr:hypothetical protein [Pseudotabrizicola algicola]NEX45231.1 hypothetical protein [Pseudotabrizicola algicola]